MYTYITRVISMSFSISSFVPSVDFGLVAYSWAMVLSTGSHLQIVVCYLSCMLAALYWHWVSRSQEREGLGLLFQSIHPCTKRTWLYSHVQQPVSFSRSCMYSVYSQWGLWSICTRSLFRSCAVCCAVLHSSRLGLVFSHEYTTNMKRSALTMSTGIAT